MARMKIRSFSVVEMEEMYFKSHWDNDKGLIFFHVDTTHSLMVNSSAVGFIT